MGILAAVAAIWYLVFYWGETQDGQQWIKSMNNFFFNTEDQGKNSIEKQQESGATGWSQ